jgi:2-polyprenyl-6-methoxyphenol hydroxylase-like FAD-dependent oxidoreductase
MANAWDAIIVGARCAGSPTALLLARRGHRVLVVDRARFPSDTISTHIVHPPAVAALARWGLRDRLVSTGCPPVHTYVFDFGPYRIAGAPGTSDSPVAYCPRRTVLDELLVRAAAEAGAEVREGFTVDGILTDGDRVVGIRGRSSHGAMVEERARVVIGADGRHSTLAAAVHPEQYHERPPILCGYYTYWSGLPMENRFETYVRAARGFAAAPTHDGLTLVIAGWPYAEFEANKGDVEGHYLRVFDQVPSFAARLRSARREARIAGAAVPNYFRKPYGPGWALVGDAGYNKDPITAQGIADAFHDAERCTAALHDALTGARAFDASMAEYQRERDEHALPMYDFTCQVASLEPPPPEVEAVFRATTRSQAAMDAFARMNAGVISPAEFFSPENVGRILAPVEAGRDSASA